MKKLLLGLSMAVLVVGKPELYREKEDFQFSRSSSDEGSKSGYYDAQRGNMGGNYERAHNMDVLAQHQMGGLVKQVEGELGDASKTRTGSVFTAANSQGIYGSGRYDLSNVQGRNFQERATFLDSQSYLSAGRRAHSLQYSALNNDKYNTGSQLHSSGFSDLHQSDNLQKAQNFYGTNEYGHGLQSQDHSINYLQSGYQGVSDYEQSNINHKASNNFGTSTQNRLISQVPVRIVVRPGTRVAIPLATQTQSGLQAASYDQSSADSKTEFLHSGAQQAALKPNSNDKQYESSYLYNKEWEQHDTKPATVPSATRVFPILKNSEQYDESRQHRGTEYTQNVDRNTDYNLASSHIQQQTGFNSQNSALSSESGHQADYNTQQHAVSSNLNSNAYSQSGYDADTNSHSAHLIGTITSKPKSYQSSYSYHKSWERQGDPYVIIPPTNGAYTGTASQRLTDLSGSHGQFSAQNYGSRKSHQTYSINDCDICDPNSHIRVARSYNSDLSQYEEQQKNAHDEQESSDQQSNGWGEIQSLGQKSQDSWDNLGQQTQNKWDNLADFGQQNQNNWQNLEQLGQKPQSNWEQQTQDAGQQVQNKWDNLEDLGQQTQNKWDQQTQNAGQQIQNEWNHLQDLGQQTQNMWEQHTQNATQDVQNKWQNLEDLEQQTHNNWKQSQETENKWDLSQQTLSGGETNAGQQISNGWNDLEAFKQQSEKGQDQQTQNSWDTHKQEEYLKPTEIEDLGQKDQNQWKPLEEQDHHYQASYGDTQHTELEDLADSHVGLTSKIPNNPSQAVNLNQQTQSFDLEQGFHDQNIFKQTINSNKSHGPSFPSEIFNQYPHGWNHIEKESLNKDSRHSTENIDRNKPDYTVNYVTSTTKPVSQTIKKGPNNIGSLNSLWGKLDDLDGDIAPSSLHTIQTQNTDISTTSNSHHVWEKVDNFEGIIPQSKDSTLQTQSTNFSQSLSSHGAWEKLDTYDGHIAPSVGNTLQTQNTDITQTSSSQNSFFNWQSSYNHDTLSTDTEEHKQHFNNTNHHAFDMWSQAFDRNNNTDELSTTITSNIFNEKTSENNFLALTNKNKITVTTEKSHHHEENIRTTDFGRGDIGPEDSLILLTKDLPTSTTTKPKPDSNSDQNTIENNNNYETMNNNTIKQDHNKDQFLIIQGEPTRKIMHISDEQVSLEPYDYQKTTQRQREDDSHNYYKPKPYHHIDNDELPEEIEQQFETQNVKKEFQLHHKHTSDYFEQNSDQNQNTDFGNLEDEKSEPWKQHHQQTYDDFADQQLADFSQTNQQWESDDQQIQQQLRDDFYQQNQHTPLQNRKLDHNNVQSTLADFGRQNVKSEFDVIPINKQPEKIVTEDHFDDFEQKPNTKQMVENNVGTTLKPETENTGFWKSLGNKFASAKKKVSSWFD